MQRKKDRQPLGTLPLNYQNNPGYFKQINVRPTKEQMNGTKTAGRSSELVTNQNSSKNRVHDVRVRYMGSDIYPRRREGPIQVLDGSQSHVKQIYKPELERPAVVFPATEMNRMNSDVLEAVEDDHRDKTYSGDVEVPDLEVNTVEEIQAMALAVTEGNHVWKLVAETTNASSNNTPSTFWTSSRAYALFNVHEGGNVKASIEEDIAFLNRMIIATPYKTKEWTELLDAPQEVRKYCEATRGRIMEQVGVKAIYVKAALSVALKMMPAMTWTMCCQWAIERLLHLPIQTNLHVHKATLVASFYREFRKSKGFSVTRKMLEESGYFSDGEDSGT